MNTKPGPSDPPYHPPQPPSQLPVTSTWTASLPDPPPYLSQALQASNVSDPIFHLHTVAKSGLLPTLCPPVSGSTVLSPPQHSSLVIFPENLPVMKSCGLFHCLCPSLLLPCPRRGPSPQLGPCPHSPAWLSLFFPSLAHTSQPWPPWQLGLPQLPVALRIKLKLASLRIKPLSRIATTLPVSYPSLQTL